MKKIYFIAIFFIALISTLIYNADKANSEINHFLALQKNVDNTISTNRNLDILISNRVNYNDFSDIQKEIDTLSKLLKSITNNYFFNTKVNYLKKDFFSIKEDIAIKIDRIYTLCENNKVLNKAYFKSKDVYKKLDSNKYINLYSDILLLEHNMEFNFDTLYLEILNLKKNINRDEEIFLESMETVLNYYSGFNYLKDDVRALEVGEKLKVFKNRFNSSSKVIINEIKFVLVSLLILLILAIAVFVFYANMVVKKQVELNRFRQAVENSDNIIIITDVDQNIKYVNEGFIKSTGYDYKEVIGKKPSIFKSGAQDEKFYDELNDTIYSGKKWVGEFINNTKDGKLLYEKASITPIFDEEGNIVEFLSIKLDVTNEVTTQKKLKQREHLLAQQSKMVAMGEILDSIAHQWRQPLSTITTAASGMKLNKEFGTLSDEEFEKYTDTIVESSLYLSKTIDGFKAFFASNNKHTLFDIDTTVEKAKELVKYKLATSNIEVVSEIEDVKVEGIETELIQAMVNIFNNSQDALASMDLEKRYIFVDIYKKEDELAISIKDNANGIDEAIIDKVMEPYFTTKHEAQGTGIGLYMSYEIIVKHFEGSFLLQNSEYYYKNKKYKGVEIIMTIPFKKKSKDETLPKY